MYFKRIEIQGFKSFAEPVVVDFHPGVTCIVGPNGSGKSNISDAIRCVLGEQSPRMLRGGKMEEVIFNGTASRKSRGMAEVTLVIDNSQGILPTDYNEVAITRRMYRSGESEYLINNNQCRLRDVRELIMDTGIGVDGYSIIGQGKVQNIIEGKPEERREILEESAGVVMYKSRKREAENKLDKANVNLDRLNDIIYEIESRIGGLKEDSEKAKEALEIRAKKKDLDINIALHNIDRLNAQGSTSEEDAEALKEDIEKHKADKAGLDEKIEEERLKNEKLQALGDKAREELLSIVNKLNDIKNKTQMDETRLSAMDSDVERLTAEIEALNTRLEKEMTSNEEKENTLFGMEEDLTKATKALEAEIDGYNKIMSVSISKQQSLEDIKNEILELSRKASGLRSESRSFGSMKETLLKRQELLLSDSQEVSTSSSDTEDEIKEAEALKEANDRDGNLLLEKLSQADSKVRELDSDLENLEGSIGDLKIKRSQLTARKKALEEMEASYEGYGGAVKFIMNGSGHGLRGTVAELIDVPKGFETAIETALGSGISNIVCEKDQDAKNAIRRLKEASAGRITFLPMESVKGTRAHLENAVEKANGFEGLASEIVTFDPEYRGVMDYLLGRTAVVKDLDTAVRLSKIAGRGFRFVTLEGDVVNASGAITGGKYRTKTMNILSRRTEIAGLGDEITAIDRDLEIKESKRISTRQEIQDIQIGRRSFEQELEVLKAKDVELQARLAALRESLKNASEAKEKRLMELASIEEELKNTAEMETNSARSAEEIEQKIRDMESSSDDLLKEIEETSSKVTDANTAITNARIRRTEIENKIDALNGLLEISQDNIDDLTEQIDRKQDELDAITEKRDRLLYGSDDSEDKFNVLSDKKTGLESYIAEIDKDKAEALASVKEMTQELNLKVEELNQLIAQKQQQEIRMARNDAQLEALKQKLLDDHEITYAQALNFKIEDFHYSQAVKETREMKVRLDEIGDFDPASIEEYQKVSERYEFMLDQRKDITAAMDELNSIIRDMDKIIKERFRNNFDQVEKNFEEIFTEMFGGGTATIAMDNEDDPLNSGIEIIAQPPGKKLQNINLLSGGEKSMTAIALMFAVLKTKPTPFCILDEVEAALDDMNIDRFADYLKNFHDIQFVVVTHQKATMEHADVLYGVTMPEQGVSRVISLRLGSDFEL